MDGSKNTLLANVNRCNEELGLGTTTTTGRKDGHVILSVSFQKISIQACSVDGAKQDQIKNFAWPSVSDYGLDGGVFHFTISKSNSERKISLTTPFSDYVCQSFDRITESRARTKKMTKKKLIVAGND